MKEIPLNHGLIALVDDKDAEKILSLGPWHASKDRWTFYACKTLYQSGRKVTTRMHTAITGLPYVDHINGNGLDNRRENLRGATPSQNAMNRGVQVNNTSGYKGVTEKRGKWRAQIQVQGRCVYLGTFIDAADAALAYDTTARLEHGEYATLNFPRLGERPAGPIYQGV